MNLHYSLAHENYKQAHGIFSKTFAMDQLEINQQTIALISARRDWAALQLLLKADEDMTLTVKNRPSFTPHGPLVNVRIEVDLDGFPDSDLSVMPVGYVEDDDRQYRPDVLLEDDTVFVERLKVQPVWIEAAVSADRSPGIYQGTIRIYTHKMFEDEILARTMTFTLRVYDVALDDPGDNRFYLNLWLHMSNIARKHEVPLWSDRHFEILEHYVRSLAQLGQKSVMLFVSEIPWSGQNCFKIVNNLSDLFEYSMVRISRSAAGEFRYDFSVLEKYIDLCSRYGISREIEVHGLLNIWTCPAEGYAGPAADYPDAIRLRYLDEADGCGKYMKLGAEIRQYMQALEQFFVRKGIVDIVRITADEPGDILAYQLRVQALKEIVPRMKIKTIVGHPEFLSRLDCFAGEEMDLIVHLEAACDDWAAWQKCQNRISGLKGYYVCCGPQRPNTFISSPLLECRLIGLVAAFMGFDGFLRWNYTVWPDKPRERISYKYPVWQAGDTNFVYPANNGRPLLSLRYKNLKRGIEDYALIRRLQDLHPDSARIIAQIRDRVFKIQDIALLSAKSRKKPDELFSMNGEDYAEMKRTVLEALESLSN
ncbi:MAG TPA: hypothetical protein DD640_01935 [Clostridiales bacterium]|nr:hypothetical protein [Clostridiales bacterium]